MTTVQAAKRTESRLELVAPMIGLAKGGAALREDVRRRATSASENETASISEFENLRRRWRHLPTTADVVLANRRDACTHPGLEERLGK